MKKNTKTLNHEIWEKCPVCGNEYDLKIEANCPFCKTQQNPK